MEVYKLSDIRIVELLAWKLMTSKVDQRYHVKSNAPQKDIKLQIKEREIGMANSAILYIFEMRMTLAQIRAIIVILVTPCPVEPCELHHGQDYSIDINFDEQVEDELSLEICGYIGPLCVPFPTETPKQSGKYSHTLIRFSDMSFSQTWNKYIQSDNAYWACVSKY